MSSITDNARLQSVLRPYGLIPDELVSRRIREYIEVLLAWNKKVSLTAVTDPEEILRFHFGESFFATSSLDIRSGRLADLGSGAGFPGLALKLIRPELAVTLIDSNRRKAAFLQEVCRRLNISGVEILKERIEDVGKHEPYDFIVARAFGAFDEVLEWTKRHGRPSVQIALWLGLEDAKKIVSNGSEWSWRTPDLIFGSKNRVILSGTRKQS